MVCNWHGYYSIILNRNWTKITQTGIRTRVFPITWGCQDSTYVRGICLCSLVFVFSWFADAYHTFANLQLHANNTSMLVYRSIWNLPVRIIQSARRLELRWTTMCEPLMHIFSTQNEQDVLFATLPSRPIPLESTMHLKLTQVAIRLNSIFPLVINKTFYCVHIAMSYAL
jgi:hypothetical protein